MTKDMIELLKKNVSLTQFSGIEKPGKPAQWSSHQIAHHLLSMEDTLIPEDEEYCGICLTSLPAPLIPEVPPVYTKEEQERRERLLRSKGKQVRMYTKWL